MSNTKPEVKIFDKSGTLSREYLLSRGYCCKLGCKNCPYKEKDKDHE